MSGTSYSAAERAFVKQYAHIPRQELRALFALQFDRPEIKVYHLRGLYQRNGWYCNDRGTTSRAKIYSKAEIEFLERHKTMGRRTLLALFVKKFKRHDVTLRNLEKLICRKGWQIRAHRPIKRVRPGTEYINHFGYVYVRLEDVHCHGRSKRHFEAKHILEWTKVNRSVPDGYVLKCMDGNKLNCDPSNWECVPKGMVIRLNKRSYEDAPAKIKPTIVAVAKLEHELNKRKRR